MKLVGKIPVEPLDDDRLTNLERRVVANAGDRLASPRRARRPYVAYAGALAAVAIAGIVGWKLHRQAPAIGSELAGATEVLAVHTDAKQSVIDIGDATIESSPNTAFAVTRPAGGVLVDMQRGKVELAVGKRGSRPPLVVRAGDTDVIVVGTRFSVDFHDGHGDPDVRVTEGVVRVVKRMSSIEVKVAAGHAWHLGTGVVALGPVIEPGTDANDPAIVIDTHVPDPRDHIALVPDAHLPLPPPHLGSASVLAGGPEATHRPPGIDPPGDPRAARKADIRRVALAPPVDVHEPDPARAVAAYIGLLRDHKSSEDESRAMYGIAYVDHIKLGRSEDAIAMLRQFKARFSGKHYAEYDDALWLEVRIDCLDDHRGADACRDAASRYLRDASPGATGRTVALALVQ